MVLMYCTLHLCYLCNFGSRYLIRLFGMFSAMFFSMVLNFDTRGDNFTVNFKYKVNSNFVNYQLHYFTALWFFYLYDQS